MSSSSSSSLAVPGSSGAQAPEGLPQLVPFEPVSADLAAGVADCVANPIQAQYTWDSITSLIESCRRMRMQNWEAVQRFPERGPVFQVQGSAPAAHEPNGAGA
eukprot:gb/GFBE01046857.1/.p1 GENE.gb/GFBE01046857.1/~~gb/GFBE01046857.1/.p1  ORF type:complete len:103 (+),score=14.70 gb/GFBE01046857.1/:1-309(+)